MKIFLNLILAFVLVSGTMNAQSCAGKVSFSIENATGTNISGDVVLKNITHYTAGMAVHNAQKAVYRHDKLANTNISGFNATSATAPAAAFSKSASKVELASDCGFYLIQLELEYAGETMFLAFYNVEGNKNFEMASPIVFDNNKLYVDVMGGTNLVSPSMAGLFIIPSNRLNSFGSKINVNN